MNPHPNDPKGESGSKKTPLQLLPPYALAQIALAHKEGAEKYGPWNWRETGVCATTYIGAIMRHLAAWQDGEDIDPDSGLSHLAKIGACCNILLDAEHCGKLVDDRSKVFGTPCDPASGWGSVNSEQTLVESIKESLGKVVNERIANSWAAKLALELSDFKDTPVPFDDLPPLPPVPEGYDRWEYRGMGWNSENEVMMAYAKGSPREWIVDECISLGQDNLHYLEAVK